MTDKLVRKALNHRSITPALRYAHVLDEEVAEALERVPEKLPESTQAENFISKGNMFIDPTRTFGYCRSQVQILLS
jgi:hypothetical protein